jgi:MFS family permease
MKKGVRGFKGDDEDEEENIKKNCKDDPKKNVILLGASSMFNDFSAEMITPVLPFYITALGGAGFAIGALSGLREGLASLFKIVGGWISDRTGKRKPLIFLGYLISLISRLLLLLANSWQWVIGFVSLERFGKMRDAPRDAMIASYGSNRGRNFGIQQLLDNIGGILGIAAVIILFWKFNIDFKLIIVIASIIAILSIVPLFFVEEKKYSKDKESLIQGVREINKKLKYFVLVASVFTLANFGISMFLLLRVEEITGSILISLGTYALFNISYAIFVMPFGKLSDKIGRKKVLMMGYVLFFIVSLGLIFFSSLTFLIVAFVLYGVVLAITHANQRAFASDLMGKMKGTSMGFYHSVIGVVNIPAGIIAGLLWDISPTIMFIYIAIVAFIAVILLHSLKEGNQYKK